MTKFNKMFKQHAVAIYFVLTIILTWGCMALAIYPSGFPISDEVLETSGAMVYVAMLIGPTAAGLLVTGLADGRKGFRQLFSRLGHWRVNIKWYAIAILTAPMLITLLLTVLSQFSTAYKPTILSSADPLGLALSSIAAGLAVGLFEELGWTGVAVPRMRLKMGLFKTGLLLGIVWGAWHFPPFWASETFVKPVAFILLLAQLFTWLPSYRILMVWVYDRTGSLLVCVLMHASLMGSLNALVPAELSGTSLLTWILTWAAALWVLIGIGSLILRKQSLSKETQIRPARQ
ncbi:MAG: CPBP family intramembrane metalloprotease [Anaerolineaceae bacterium]|nr:CPBP family intramembrane metalloprotease [Anaerolineaceae bacterium]